MRAWAVKVGVRVGARGRVGRSVRLAYARAHGVEYGERGHLELVEDGLLDARPTAPLNVQTQRDTNVRSLPSGMARPPRETMADGLERLIDELARRGVLKSEHFALVAIARHLADDLDIDRSNAQLVRQYVDAEARLRELLSLAEDDEGHEPPLALADTVGMTEGGW